MLKFAFKTLTLLCLPFFAYGFGTIVYKTGTSSVLPKQNLIAFLIGAILFACFWRIFKRHLQVVCTFEHELTHLIFGLLFFKRPHSFVVTRHDGGYVEMSGGNFVITLAPYFFPTVSYAILPLIFFIPKTAMPIFLTTLGASVSFHLLSTWLELHWKQTDLHDAGILFSLIFLPTANLIFYGALIAIVIGNDGSFWQFWVNGAEETLIIFLKVFKLIF